MKVAIYCRVSVADKDKDKPRDSESIDTQETRCRHHAQAQQVKKPQDTGGRTNERRQRVHSRK